MSKVDTIFHHPAEIAVHKAADHEYDFGILHHPSDEAIAARLILKLSSYGFSSCSYDDFFDYDLTCGQKCKRFFEHCLCILWICSHESLTDTGHLKYCQDASFHYSIQHSSKHGVHKFIALIMQEYIHLPKDRVVPMELSIYRPLIEKRGFKRKLHLILNRIHDSHCRAFQMILNGDSQLEQYNSHLKLSDFGMEVQKLDLEINSFQQSSMNNSAMQTNECEDIFQLPESFPAANYASLVEENSKVTLLGMSTAYHDNLLNNNCDDLKRESFLSSAVLSSHSYVLSHLLYVFFFIIIFVDRVS